MKNKHIALLTVGLLATASVWAGLPTSGVWPATTVSADETVELTGDVDLQGTITVSSGVTLTVKLASSAISDVNIRRSASVRMFTVNGTLVIKGSADDKRIVIDGNYVSGSGNTGYGIYGDGGSAVVSLDYTVLKNFYHNGYGSAVVMSSGCSTASSFSMQNSSVISCSYTGSTTGGVLYFSSNKSSSNTDTYPVSIKNCVFSDNVNTGTDGSAGGVIYAEADKSIVGEITSCTFSGNSSSICAGAVNWRTQYPGLTVSDCIFNSNSGKYGSAVTARGNLTMTSCSFDNNTAYYGTVYDDIGSVAMTSCTFTNNTASIQGSNVQPQGGAVFAKYGGSFTSCTFSKNTSYFEGGAIYSNRSITVDDCDFSENEAAFGGAIFDYTTGQCDIVIKGGSTFKSNKTVTNTKYTTDCHGGAIYIRKANASTCSLTVSDNCIFEKNIATSGNGGALCVNRENTSNQCNVNVSYATVSGNTADLNGGGFCFMGSDYNSISVDNTVFKNNIANTASGGGMALLKRSSTLTVSNCTFDTNKSLTTDGNGGGMYVYRSQNLSFTNNEFKCNIAEGNGGGSSIDGAETAAIISGGSYHDNTAVNGGAIAIVTTTAAYVTVQDACSIHDNTASTDGGAIYLKKSNSSNAKLTLSEGCELYNNTAQQGNGGAVCVLKDSDNDCSATINAVIRNNTAKLDGGGAYFGGTVNLSTILIDGAKFTSNTSQESNGGGLALGKYANTFTISNSTFTSNVSTLGNGGGAYFFSGNTITLTGNEFSGNTAKLDGGAASFDAGNTVKISGGSYHDNGATQNGGAFSFSSTNGQIIFSVLDDCNIQNNTAAVHGGAIYLNKLNSNNATLTIGSSVIQSNVATSGNGGGIAAYRDNTSNTFSATFSGGTIKSNRAEQGNGGGVYILAGTTSSKGTVSFSGDFTVGGDSADDANKAIDGAGMYLDYANLGTVKYGTFKNNIATGNGGGIYARGLYQTTFTENGSNYLTVSNNSAVNGGGMYITDAYNTYLNRIDIKDNTATGNGGGVYVDGCSDWDFGYVNSHYPLISGNKAVDGAGMYLLNLTVSYFSCADVLNNTASGNGGGLYISGGTSHRFDFPSATIYTTVSGNTAANGAGMYLTGGASCQIDYTKFTGNHAIGANPISTAWKSIPHGTETIQGVGGGIYIASGSSTASTILTFSRTDYFGIYDNVADNGAAELFADGGYTKLTLPQNDIKNMALVGSSYKATGWYEDYVTDDIHYDEGTLKGVEGGRYPSVISPIQYSSVSANTKYICLTLGYGRSIIVKVTGLRTDENAVFTLVKDGTSAPYESFALTGTSDDGSAVVTRTVRNLELGSWTVKESGWGWSYTSDPVSLTKELTGSDTTVEYPFTLTKSKSVTGSETKATNNFDANGFRVKISVNSRGIQDGGTIGL